MSPTGDTRRKDDDIKTTNDYHLEAIECLKESVHYHEVLIGNLGGDEAGMLVEKLLGHTESRVAEDCLCEVWRDLISKSARNLERFPLIIEAWQNAIDEKTAGESCSG